MKVLKSILLKIFTWHTALGAGTKKSANMSNSGSSRLTNKFVLVRHGESEWNNLNLFCGWHDADLSEKGTQDARNITAAALRDYKFEFDVAYTSALKRAQQSLCIILKELKCENLPVIRTWHINERHYGNLTGYNKRSMADKYGEEQVQIWRRSYNIPPPPITPDNPYYDGIRNNPRFKDIPADKFPNSESLEIVMQRVIPYYESCILQDIISGKRVLICAHGTVARALVKHIDNISDQNIKSVNIPNSIPCVIEIDKATRKKVGKIEFLAEENFLNKEMEKTASIGN